MQNSEIQIGENTITIRPDHSLMFKFASLGVVEQKELLRIISSNSDNKAKNRKLRAALEKELQRIKPYLIEEMFTEKIFSTECPKLFAAMSRIA